MYDTVVIATDGSDGTREAVAHGLGLAERYDATVHALCVVDLRVLAGDDEGFDDGLVFDLLKARARRATDEIARQADERGLDAVTAVVDGTPARQIRRYADEHDADLVAMGTRGRSGIARTLLGSVAESVLRNASQPVLTAKARSAPAEVTYDDVLLPTDGSEQAERVARHAVDVARRYDATVHALSVVDTSLLQSPLLLAALEGEAERAVSEAEQQVREAGVDVETRVWRGAPAECIADYVDQHGVDLVTMGTHGRRGLDRFLTPSVAERVVRTAGCPVMTLRGNPDGD